MSRPNQNRVEIVHVLGERCEMEATPKSLGRPAQAGFQVRIVLVERTRQILADSWCQGTRAEAIEEACKHATEVLNRQRQILEGVSC